MYCEEPSKEWNAVLYTKLGANDAENKQGGPLPIEQLIDDMSEQSQTALKEVHVLLCPLSYFLCFQTKGGAPGKSRYLAPDPLGVRGMLGQREQMSAARVVIIDECCVFTVSM